MKRKLYPIVTELPVADFWYKGNHSHPVRRKVLVTEETADTLKGYEIRCGRRAAQISAAPLKSYRLDAIARVADLDKRRKLVKTTPKNKVNQSTLVRKALESLVGEGI